MPLLSMVSVHTTLPLDAPDPARTGIRAVALTQLDPDTESVFAAAYPDLAAEPPDRVVLDVDHPLLERD